MDTYIWLPLMDTGDFYEDISLDVYEVQIDDHEIKTLSL